MAVPNLKGLSKKQIEEGNLYDKGYSASDYEKYLQEQAKKFTYDYSNYNRTPNSYSQEKADIYNQYKNFEPFSYDLSTDMLYKQYKDQYQTLGAQAMMDTMGQAAALTGGYGSSYASTAGNQAYQGYLQQLNNIVPELYSQALNRYNSELDKLANTYSMVLQQYNDEEAAKDKEYAVLADKYNAFNQQYGDEYNRNYGKWSDDYNRWLTGAQLSNDDYWQNQTLAEQQRQFNAQMAEDQRQFNANLAYQREADNYANQLSQLQNELQSQIDGTYSYSMAKEAASQSPQALVDYLDSTNLDDATKDSIYNSFFKNYTKSFLYNLGQKKLSDIRQNAREKK